MRNPLIAMPVLLLAAVLGGTVERSRNSEGAKFFVAATGCMVLAGVGHLITDLLE